MGELQYRTFKQECEHQGTQADVGKGQDGRVVGWRRLGYAGRAGDGSADEARERLLHPKSSQDLLSLW